MSGAGRRSAYRKHVTEEILNGLPEIDAAAGERLAKIGGARGGNLYEVMAVEQDGAVGDAALAILPQKFHKLIWIKTGDWVIVEGADSEDTDANGVGLLIKHILYDRQVKHLKAVGQWPLEEEAVGDAAGTAVGAEAGAGAGAGAIAGGGRAPAEGAASGGGLYIPDDDDLMVNTNRDAMARARRSAYDDSSESESESDGS